MHRAFLALSIVYGFSGPACGAEVHFGRDILPILADACFKCHGPDANTREADLRLDTRAGAFADREGYAIIAAGDPNASELISRVSSSDESLRMPPVDSGRVLTAREIDRLRQWIAEGANWDDHWAFRPPVASHPPTVRDTAWPKNPLDRFVLARLEQAKLTPSPPAPRETLIRRVTLDLTGLPPTLAEVDAFLADDSPDAYERLVDRLLASPRYGEHIATAWLDAARYADSNGYQQERTRTLWPWRDWVIRAFNADMPYDRFTVEQLAGDLLARPTLDQRIATGFNRNHMLNGEGGRIAEESRVEYVVDRVETTATVWLGLTLGCCRCHDHKYDPVSQEEFYRFYAYFNSIDEIGGVDRGGNAKPVLSLPTADQSRREAELTTKLSRLELELKTPPDGRTAEVIQKDLDEARKALDQLRKSYLETMVMQDREQPRETYRLVRGQWDNPDKSKRLTPGVPSVLPPLPADASANRLALARWLVRDDHPLTARVAVNREWQRFFGIGLVATPEDFGTQGERPSHPALLDWLATEFVRRDWSLKELHRTIVTSATYRQSGRIKGQGSRVEGAEKIITETLDPQRLYARGPRLRMTSQMLRDQALAISGLLVERFGGAPVKPYQPEGVWLEMTLGKIKYDQDHGDALYRRSVYVFWRRSVGPTTLFDTSARQVCSVRPNRTNTPLHALTLMNDPAFVEAARVFAERAMRHGDSPQQRLAWAFRRATLRRPSAVELDALTAIFQQTQQHFADDPTAAEQLLAVGEYPRDKTLDERELAAYAAVANVILNLDEVVTKE